MIKFKGSNVQFNFLHHEMVGAVNAASGVLSRHGKDLVITSGNDGKHTKKNSLHYKDLAIDIRSKHLSREVKESVLSELRSILQPDYDVLLEYIGKSEEHFHVEFDPKGNLT